MVATGFHVFPGCPGLVATGALDTRAGVRLPAFFVAALDWLPQPPTTAASSIATMLTDAGFTLAAPCHLLARWPRTNTHGCLKTRLPA
jgi:hypothetical protein